jgi:succinate dehydrogenase (ubiquinone) cytochrome b560 subunit
MNGIRHLIWDTATMIKNKQVQQTGWAVVGLSVISALGLALM